MRLGGRHSWWPPAGRCGTQSSEEAQVLCRTMGNAEVIQVGLNHLRTRQRHLDQHSNRKPTEVSKQVVPRSPCFREMKERSSGLNRL